MKRTVRRRLRSRMVVTLKTGESFDGVLVEADAEAWVLVQAKALAAGVKNEDLSVDGEILLLTADIAYAQKP